MAFADSSSTRLAFLAESTENTIPGSPTWQNLRITSESLNYNKQTVVSDEILPNRNVADLIFVGYGAGGDFGFELSYGTLDTLLEGLMFSSWSSDRLKNGTTPKSFAFEKTFETGATDAYLRYTGMQVDTLSLDITARQIITGSATLLGMGHSTGIAALSGATYTDANTNAVMSASADVGSLSLSGISPSPTLMSANIQVTNNLREKIAVSNQGPIGIGAGRCIVTGSLEAYFESLALYNAFMNHDDVAIALTMGSVTNEKYTITLPKTKLSNGIVNTGGNDQDIMASIEFQALYDTSGSPANNASIIIDRAVA
jgi:hypothetical protein